MFELGIFPRDVAGPQVSWHEVTLASGRAETELRNVAMSAAERRRGGDWFKGALQQLLQLLECPQLKGATTAADRLLQKLPASGRLGGSRLESGCRDDCGLI